MTWWQVTRSVMLLSGVRKWLLDGPVVSSSPLGTQSIRLAEKFRQVQLVHRLRVLHQRCVCVIHWETVPRILSPKIKARPSSSPVRRGFVGGEECLRATNLWGHTVGWIEKVLMTVSPEGFLSRRTWHASPGGWPPTFYNVGSWEIPLSKSVISSVIATVAYNIPTCVFICRSKLLEQ